MKLWYRVVDGAERKWTPTGWVDQIEEDFGFFYGAHALSRKIMARFFALGNNDFCVFKHFATCLKDAWHFFVRSSIMSFVWMVVGTKFMVSHQPSASGCFCLFSAFILGMLTRKAVVLFHVWYSATKDSLLVLTSLQLELTTPNTPIERLTTYS